MSEWRPIETAPKDGTYILFWPGRGVKGYRGPVTGYWHQPGNPKSPGFWVTGTSAGRQHATHWMPIPAAPEETR